MPRLILATDLAALLCLSLLLGPGLTGLAGDRAPVDGALGIVVVSVAIAGAVIMLITEWFTGIRWVPALTLISLVVVSLVGWSSVTAHSVSTAAVCVGWAAMAYWFATLAFRSRENR